MISRNSRNRSYRLFSEAVAAVNRAVVVRFEGNLANLAASGANRFEHLTVSASAGAAAFFSIAARLAALRFVCEALFGEKFLLAGSEGEFVTAIAADQSLVVVHIIPQK